MVLEFPTVMAFITAMKRGQDDTSRRDHGSGWCPRSSVFPKRRDRCYAPPPPDRSFRMNCFQAVATGHVALFRATGGAWEAHGRRRRSSSSPPKGARPAVRVPYPSCSSRRDGDRAVIASAGGSPTHPGGSKNLERDPSVTVEVKGRKFAARAEIVERRDKTSPHLQPRRSHVCLSSRSTRKDSGGRQIRSCLLKETRPPGLNRDAEVLAFGERARFPPRDRVLDATP